MVNRVIEDKMFEMAQHLGIIVEGMIGELIALTREMVEKEKRRINKSDAPKRSRKQKGVGNCQI